MELWAFTDKWHPIWMILVGLGTFAVLLVIVNQLVSLTHKRKAIPAQPETSQSTGFRVAPSAKGSVFTNVEAIGFDIGIDDAGMNSSFNNAVVSKEYPLGHGPSKPELRLAMSGGNIFTLVAPGLRGPHTGILLNAKVWNVGKPSVATTWALLVFAQDKTPVIAQHGHIPDQLILSGKFSNRVIRASDALDEKTKTTPITEIPIEGILLFYVPLSKSIVLEQTTKLVLSVKDINEFESITEQVVGRWIQR